MSSLYRYRLICVFFVDRRLYIGKYGVSIHEYYSYPTSFLQVDRTLMKRLACLICYLLVCFDLFMVRLLYMSRINIIICIYKLSVIILVSSFNFNI